MCFHLVLSLMLHFRKTNHVCVRPTPPRISKATVFVHARQPETFIITNVYICFWSLRQNTESLIHWPSTVGLPQWAHLFIYALVLELCSNMHNENHVTTPDTHQMAGLVHSKRLWSLRWTDICSSPVQSWAENLKNRNPFILIDFH